MKIIEAVSVAKFAAIIINSLSCYTPAARKSEIKKYGARELEEKIKSDKFSVLLAFDGKDIVGFLFSKWDDATIWLEWIGVAKSERRKGIASLLLESLSRTMPKRKAHKSWCDCRTTNHASKRLLVSAGYKKLAVITNHWFKQDYILWQKEFK
jgi:ribosomal protein S18 acetylase RimI-like enzyme